MSSGTHHRVAPTPETGLVQVHPGDTFDDSFIGYEIECRIHNLNPSQYPRHVGIVVGRDRILHWSKLDGFKVVCSDVRGFLGTVSPPATIHHCSRPKVTREQVLANAALHLGRTDYAVTQRNCQHLSDAVRNRTPEADREHLGTCDDFQSRISSIGVPTVLALAVSVLCASSGAPALLVGVVGGGTLIVSLVLANSLAYPVNIHPPVTPGRPGEPTAG